MTPSWYDVLGVEPTASEAEIRAAWKAAIADLDPTDRRFRSANQAAEVLLDPDRRAVHDAQLAAEEPEPAHEADPVTAAASPAPTTPTTTTTTTTTDGGADTRPTAGRAPRVVPGWLLAVVAVLAAASVGLAAWLVADVRGDGESVEDAARAAQSTAERVIVPVLSFDYRNLEEDQARARSYLTPAYRKEYDKLFGVISDNAPSTRTVVTGEVLGSGLVRTDDEGTRVDVLLFVDRSTQRKDLAQPQVSYDQVTVTMVERDGDWLVDGLDTTPLD